MYHSLRSICLPSWMREKGDIYCLHCFWIRKGRRLWTQFTLARIWCYITYKCLSYILCSNFFLCAILLRLFFYGKDKANECTSQLMVSDHHRLRPRVTSKDNCMWFHRHWGAPTRRKNCIQYIRLILLYTGPISILMISTVSLCRWHSVSSWSTWSFFAEIFFQLFFWSQCWRSLKMLS